MEAAKARAQMQNDQEALAYANSASISTLTAERDMMMRTLCNEIEHVETDAHLSLGVLLHQLRTTHGNMLHQGQELSGATAARTVCIWLQLVQYLCCCLG